MAQIDTFSVYSVFFLVSVFKNAPQASMSFVQIKKAIFPLREKRGDCDLGMKEELNKNLFRSGCFQKCL